MMEPGSSYGHPQYFALSPLKQRHDWMDWWNACNPGKATAVQWPSIHVGSWLLQLDAAYVIDQ